MALTATATKRVRKDIVDQLHLDNARCYVASFNRPNLTYRVVPKSSPYEQVLTFIRSRPNESGIVYRSEEHTSELQSHLNLVCRLLLEKKKKEIRQLIRYL